MNKLTKANPTLSFTKRKNLMSQFVPRDLETDDAIAGFIESKVDEIEDYVGQIRDEYCAGEILSWS
jgi:hypothetical protein